MTNNGRKQLKQRTVTFTSSNNSNAWDLPQHNTYIQSTTSRISKYSSKKRNGKTTTKIIITTTQQHNRDNNGKALEVYKIEPIATFLDHRCVNVVERILKDPKYPITQKQTVKSHHNTRSS
jgi:hypothetical protein